ncbi:MAG: hypothetical protein RIT35_316, partial [Pseudomonadota bacterium]
SSSIVSNSITKQRVTKWRIITTYVFGAGVLVLVINTIIPGSLVVITTAVFGAGLEAANAFFRSFAGTGTGAAAAAVSTADMAAAAATAGPSMVAGPSLDAIRTFGSILYTLSAATLTACGGVISKVSRTVGNAACDTMTLPNAEIVADFAAQSVVVKGITVGIDKGWDFAVKLNRG